MGLGVGKCNLWLLEFRFQIYMSRQSTFANRQMFVGKMCQELSTIGKLQHQTGFVGI